MPLKVNGVDIDSVVYNEVEVDQMFYNSVEVFVNKKATEGLEYTLLSDGSGYAVSNGTATAENVVIPDEYEGLPVKEIAANGFTDTSITSIVLPINLEVIGDSAFNGCKLSDLTLPASIKTIGNNAFSSPFKSYRGNLIYQGTLEQWLEITFSNYKSNPLGGGEVRFYIGGQEVTDIIIPEGTTTIKQYAFYYYRYAQSITLPEGLLAIETGAFGYNGKFTELVIPNTVTSIGNQAFYNCEKLANITLGDSLQTIGNSAFERCIFTTITIPESVTTIGGAAFRYTSLTSAIMEHTSWWQISGFSGTQVDLSDPSTAASILTSQTGGLEMRYYYIRRMISNDASLTIFYYSNRSEEEGPEDFNILWEMLKSYNGKWHYTTSYFEKPPTAYGQVYSYNRYRDLNSLSTNDERVYGNYSGYSQVTIYKTEGPEAWTFNFYMANPNTTK